MAITVPPTIDAPPADLPDRSDRVTFPDRAEDFTLWQQTSTPQIVAVAANVYNNATETKTYADQAAASEQAAAASSGASIWVTGTTYTAGQVRYSPINYRSYRRKTNGAGSTDPSADSTNWAEVNPLAGNSTGGLNYLKGSDIASSTTPDIWQAASGNVIGITGTTTTTGFATAPQAGATRWLRAAGAWPLTHGANLVLPNAANYTCAAGDYLLVHARTTTSFDVLIVKADGSPVGREGWVLLGSATASGSASIAFTSGINSTYDEYVICFLGLRPSSSALLRMRTSADGGSTWASSAGDYYALSQYNSTSSTTPAGYSGTSETYISIGGATVDPNAVNGGLSGEIRMYLPHDTTGKKLFRVHTMHLSGSTEANQTIGAFYRNFTAAINALQITASTGTLTGIVRLYGIKKS